MSNFNELMQKYVNTDYAVLAGMAKEAVQRLKPHCEAVDPKHNGNYMLAALILSAVGADGVLTLLEGRMLRDVLGLDKATIKQFIGMYDAKMADLADCFADNMGDDIKADTIMLVAALASADEKICKEETAFIRKLFA